LTPQTWLRAWVTFTTNISLDRSCGGWGFSPIASTTSEEPSCLPSFCRQKSTSKLRAATRS